MSALENELETVQPEEIATPQLAGMLLHFFDRHSRHCRSTDQRADARACVHCGLYSSFSESAQHTDVRKALEAAAAKHERNLPALYARLGLSLGSCRKVVDQILRSVRNDIIVCNSSTRASHD
jgi:hypothetical protein